MYVVTQLVARSPRSHCPRGFEWFVPQAGCRAPGRQPDDIVIMDAPRLT